MRHDWQQYTPTGKGHPLLLNEHRRCENCGAIQEKVTDYLWMRVVRSVPAGCRVVPVLERAAGSAFYLRRA